MSSRLFRAVVGLGISLGTASAACYGSVDPTNAGDASGSTEPSSPDKAPNPVTNPTTPTRDAAAAVDAHVDAQVDAVADAPKDAILDAFCDATWPTTKGTSGGPTCGAVEDCKDAGPAPHCYKQVTTSTCNPGTAPLPAWCVAGNWQCSGGAVTQDQCKCWTGQPCSLP